MTGTKGGPGNGPGNSGKILHMDAFRNAAQTEAEQGYHRLVDMFWAHAARDIQTILSLRESSLNTGSRTDSTSFARRLSAFRQFQEACVTQVEPSSLEFIALLAFTGDYYAVEQAFRAHETVMEQLRVDPSDKAYRALYLEGLCRNTAPVVDHLVDVWLKDTENLHMLSRLPAHDSGHEVAQILRKGGNVDLSFLRAKYFATMGMDDPQTSSAAKNDAAKPTPSGAISDKVIAFKPRPKK